MNACLSEYDVKQLLDDHLTTGRLVEIRAHLAECPSCRRRLDNQFNCIELDQARTLLSECRTSGKHETKAHFLAIREKLAHHWSKPELPAESSIATELLTAAQHPGEIGMLGQYRIIQLLGAGGMGTVFLGFDPQLQRSVAIKVLRADRHDEESRQRLVREARAAALLQHDHVVTVHSVANPADAAPYIVLQYIDGPSLRERIVEVGQLEPRAAATIAVGVAKGLTAAHAAGMVHRDIKPGNIMLDCGDGRAKIMDFGLVRQAAASDPLTHDGVCLGTPEYMSPEQIATPSLIDARTDVYGLGMTLYEMLTGTLPFRGAVHQVMHQILHDCPLTPRRLNALVPHDLDTICLKAIEKDAARRYQTAEELADDLERWLRGEPILARPVGTLGRIQRWRRRKLALAHLTAALVLIVAIGFGAVSWQWRRAEDNLSEVLRQQQQAERYLAQALHHQAERKNTETEARKMTRRADNAQGQLLSVVLQSQLRQDTNPTTVKQRFLEQIQEISREAVDQFRGRASSQLQVAGTYLCEGNLYRELAQDERSLAAYSTALRMFRMMLREKPNSNEAKHAISTTLYWMGVLQEKSGDRSTALSRHSESAGLLRELVRANPQAHNFPLELVRSRIATGRLNLATNRRQAIGSFKNARTELLALQQAAGKTFDIMTRQAVVTSYRSLGDAYRAADLQPESLALYRIACHLGRQVVEETPQFPNGHAEFAASLNHMGEFLLETGRLSEAVTAFKDAIVQQQATPKVRNFLQPRPHEKHDRYLANLSRALRLSGKFREAIDANRQRQSATTWDPEVYFSSACEITRCLEDLDKNPSNSDNIARDKTIDLAFESLKKAIDLGFSSKERLTGENSLELLRAHPDFQQLLELIPRKPKLAPGLAWNTAPKRTAKKKKPPTTGRLRGRGRRLVRVRTSAANSQVLRRRPGMERRVVFPPGAKQKRPVDQAQQRPVSRDP